MDSASDVDKGALDVNKGSSDTQEGASGFGVKGSVSTAFVV